MTIRLALPTGGPRPAVAALLEQAGVAANGYEPGSRLLRSVLDEQRLALRIFREKDIPIQVALGNYDLGICGDVWLSELQVRFPLQRLVRVGGLPGPRLEAWLCAAPASGLEPGTLPSPAELGGARLASELPNLADLVAVHMRIPAYRLIPLYGSAEVYPPEDADLLLVPCQDVHQLEEAGLVPLHRLFAGGLALVANAAALASRDLGPVLQKLSPFLTGDAPDLALPRAAAPARSFRRLDRSRQALRLALPDGHAHRHTYAALRAAGLAFEGYEEQTFRRRPEPGIPGLEVKVVRPQDMPQMVALGAFDLAVTGVDWLQEHLARFPSSPVRMAVDLGRSRYKIGPVVDEAFPAATTRAALPLWNALGRPVRVASEYPALAEAFARSVHLQYATIIPINGASEGFVPEDADILIEGSETGASIRANGLKMLDPFMESTNCVIARTEPVTEAAALLEELVARFEVAGRAVALP
jgi:ATP phosphoribosyltransferase